MQRYLHATCLKIVYKGTESAKMILFTIAAWAKQLQIDIYNYRSHLKHSKDIRATDNRKSIPRTGIGSSIRILCQPSPKNWVFGFFLTWSDLRVDLGPVGTGDWGLGLGLDNFLPSSFIRCSITKMASTLL